MTATELFDWKVGGRFGDIGVEIHDHRQCIAVVNGIQSKRLEFLKASRGSKAARGEREDSVTVSEIDRHEASGPDAITTARLMAASPRLLAACQAIVEFWDEREADELETPLHPDALIGGQPDECDPVTIRDVLRRAIEYATK